MAASCVFSVSLPFCRTFQRPLHTFSRCSIHLTRYFSTDTSGLPKLPQRPLPPFLKYYQENYKQIAVSNPDLKLTQLPKIAGTQWKTLTPEQKQAYMPTQEQLQQYKEAKESYIAALSPEQMKKIQNEQAKKRKQKLCKKFNKPKRIATTAYMVYLQHNKPEKGSSLGFTERSRMAAEKWKNLSSTEKEVYVVEAKENQLRFQQELEVWEQEMLKLGQTDLIRKMYRPIAKKAKRKTKSKAKAKKSTAKKRTIKSKRTAKKETASKKRSIKKTDGNKEKTSKKSSKKTDENTDWMREE